MKLKHKFNIEVTMEIAPNDNKDATFKYKGKLWIVCTGTIIHESYGDTPGSALDSMLDYTNKNVVQVS